MLIFASAGFTQTSTENSATPYAAKILNTSDLISTTDFSPVDKKRSENVYQKKRSASDRLYPVIYNSGWCWLLLVFYQETRTTGEYSYSSYTNNTSHLPTNCRSRSTFNITTMDRDATTPMLRELGDDGIGYATYDQVKNQSTVRAIAVDGTTPNMGNYLYQRTLYYVYKNPPNQAVEDFLGYVFSSPGRQAVAAADF